MKIITMLNQKGGVAKTTLATHLAQGLAMAGHRVVLVDADSQGSATYAVGIEYQPGFYDLIVRGTEWKDTLRFINPELYEIPNQKVKGELYLVPSNIESRTIANVIEDTTIIQTRFSELVDMVDYIVVDTSPTPSLLHGSIYTATDYILYPTKCESLSIQGLERSMESLQAANRFRGQYQIAPIEVLGIVPTMYRSKTLEHSENLAELRGKYKDLVWSPIPLSTVWGESSRMARPVWNFAYETSAAKQGIAFVSRVMKAIQQHVQ